MAKIYNSRLRFEEELYADMICDLSRKVRMAKFPDVPLVLDGPLAFLEDALEEEVPGGRWSVEGSYNRSPKSIL
jgi:hypothetical protein